MGTRHLTCVVVDGEYKVAQYGQWDGYPDGQGAQILEFLQTHDLDHFREQVRQCQWATPEDVERAWVACGADPDSRWVTLDVGKEMRDTYPQFSRDTGSKVLSVIYETPVLLENSLDFAADSLMCEWAYVIDLDKGVLEVYEGFNQEPLEDGERFADMPQVDRDREHTYYPVRLHSAWRLTSLPERGEFLEVFKEEEIDG